MQLTLSKDRKTTPIANANGTLPAVANAFGLTAGVTCPGMTGICGNVCYASAIERYPTVKGLVGRNTTALMQATQQEMRTMLSDAVGQYVTDHQRRSPGTPMIFRIHWDGDFFSPEYAQAWRDVALAHPHVAFWAYTRNPDAVPHLLGVPNLALYFSADRDNWDIAVTMRQQYPTLRLAVMDESFAAARDLYAGEYGRPLGACPEQTGQVPLIDSAGGACAKCRLCVHGKADVAFRYGKEG